VVRSVNASPKTEEAPVANSRERILQAGRSLFFREGFAGVSTERLAKEAGVSKSTLYKYFGDMSGVLRAIAEAEADHFEIDMSKPPESAEAFRKVVASFGKALITLISKPEKLQFDRLMFEESRSSPEIAAIYYEAAIERTRGHLADIIRQGQSMGFADAEADADDLADHLLSMWQGLSFVRARLGLIKKPVKHPGDWSRKCVDALFGR